MKLTKQEKRWAKQAKDAKKAQDKPVADLKAKLAKVRAEKAQRAAQDRRNELMAERRANGSNVRTWVAANGTTATETALEQQEKKKRWAAK